MGLFSKVANTGSSTDWRVTKKVWAKVNSGWVAATGVFGKTISGWVKMWPGNAPSVRLSDPINIRLGGYNGTVATSPQLFCSTDAGTSGTFLKLWGNDGSFDGATPITISNRRMLCSDNIDGQVERFSLSGNDTIDFSTTSQATRDLAEGYYIFYQLLATNVDGSLDAYSPPIKVIKRKPALVSYTVLSESGGVLTGESGFGAGDIIEVNAQIRWGWWIRPGGYLGGTPVLRWWRNTSKSPGGTLLKEINIETGYDYVSGSYDSTYLSNTNTSNVLTIYSNYTVGSNPLSSGQYIVAQLYLENSYTAHYASPVSYYGTTGAVPSITSLEIKGVDGYAEYVMDNQSTPRIISDGFIEIVAEVADYESGTTFNFEPRMYNADTGSSITYINYTTGASISSSDFPTDLSPTSITTSGTTATVKWQTSIPANGSTVTPSGPTWDGGKARYYFEFRVSATAPGKATRYYVGTVKNMGENIDYIFDESQASIPVAPSTLPTLTATPTSGGSPLTVTFGISASAYPSGLGYASYPRSYIMNFGDGSAEVVSWPTGTNNPTYSNWTHTYSNTGTYTAQLYWNPQGRLSRGTNQRSITIGNLPSTPTFLSATTTRTDGVNLQFSGSSGATSYDIFWNTAIDAPPSVNASPDFTGVSSPLLDTTISSGNTRWYWVRGRNSAGTSAWYPTTNGIQGTRAQLANPTITSLSASAPTTTSSQLVTVTVSWTSTNQSSFSCSVTQTGVASYTKYGSTETSANQSSSGSFFNVYSGASATILLRVYNGPPDSNGFPTGTYAESTITYTPPISLSKLSTPTGVNATDDRSDGVNVTWNAVSGAAYYGVWWGGAPGYDSLADFGGNRNTSLITGTSYLDTAISAGSSRDYYVQAYRSGDPSGTKSDWGGPNNGTRTSGVTYGSCEFWYSSTTFECSGTFNRDVTTTYYRRRILTNGSWDGSSYDYSESACAPTVSYGSYVFTDGRCGYTTPAFQWYCSVNYFSNQLPDEQYTSSYDQSTVECNQYRIVCSYNNTGSYPFASNPPACATTTTTTTTTTACTCVYQDMGSYHYSPQCCPSGSPRSGSLSGTTSGSCCPNVNKIQRWNCNSFDVNNSSSANWSVCFSIGQCAATSNSAGTRTICYI
jgi:hypothetical protein